MRILVTGSRGHLGEALIRAWRDDSSIEPFGVDQLDSPFTDFVGSIVDREVVAEALAESRAEVVVHAATLHKPHVATHSRQEFVDTNVTGTLHLLEESVRAGVQAFVFVSTTSAFGRALVPPAGAPAAWITEDVRPVPRNIYGVTKCAAEDLCELAHRKDRLPCVVLRTSRFFPEADDNRATRDAYDDANAKANEMLYRRVDLADIVDACRLAIDRADALGFARFIVSATTPFTPDELLELREDAPRVVARHYPDFESIYASRGWRMFPSIERVYVNHRARTELGWRPRYDFRHALDCVAAGEDFRSPLARAVGAKGYHDRTFDDGPYPVDA